MTLPSLPRETYSALGPISVGVLQHEVPGYDNLFGRFMPAERRIEVAQDATPAMLWSTFWHEATHVALFDSGANNVLTEQQIEVVCDALGAYLAGMTVTGYITHATGKIRSHVK